MTDPTEPRPPDEPTDLSAFPDAAALLGAAGAIAPPPGLRARVLTAALRSRSAGSEVDGPEPISAPSALRAALGQLASLVDGLDDADGLRPSIEGWSVSGLLGHLGAIEEHFGAVLGWWEEPPLDPTLELDHLAMTVGAVRSAEAAGLEAARSSWKEAVGRVLARLDSLEDRLAERVAFHGFDFSVRSLLIARTFEVWTHGEDIARATGRPVPEPDRRQFHLMADAAVGALPLGMALSGLEPAGRSVRVVLVGAGGGAWTRSLEIGADPGEPSATVVTDVVDFCRVAAKRLAPADLSCQVDGDADLVADVLVAAAIFAA